MANSFVQKVKKDTDPNRYNYPPMGVDTTFEFLHQILEDLERSIKDERENDKRHMQYVMRQSQNQQNDMIGKAFGSHPSSSSRSEAKPSMKYPTAAKQKQQIRKKKKVSRSPTVHIVPNNRNETNLKKEVVSNQGSYTSLANFFEALNM